MLRQRDGVGGTGFQPAVCRNQPVAGVDSQNQLSRELAAHFSKPFRLFDCQRPDNGAGQTGVKQFRQNGFFPNPAAQFAGNVDRLKYRLDGGHIDRFAVFCPVEVNQMQMTPSFRRPFLSHFRRVRAEYGLLVVVALLKSDALSAA